MNIKACKQFLVSKNMNLKMSMIFPFTNEFGGLM